ncbi:MAG: tRNA-dihydrouridine synthase [Deltaproteobacteria bacterium]|nr:tRNA-dihydrouridine synthase [Deltaproteobacteria bacterium]
MPFSWQNLPKPIFGLAPMDGVTDHVFRSIVYNHGAPDVMFTEFVSVEGLSRHIPALLEDLKYLPHERPIIAQIYGYELKSFRESVKIIAELGFDGVDINMGCPAKSVVHSGGGAALINASSHAKAIIKICGETLKEVYEKSGRQLPLSVKTRLGYSTTNVREWIGQLLDCKELSNISIHGRTLKQAYTGEADWEAIASAVELAKGSGKTILGNGDLKNLEHAVKRIEETQVDGVLLGRASYGNPWLFRDKESYRSNFNFSSLEIPLKTRIQALLDHAELLQNSKAEKNFIQIRKHAGWYMRGFPGAADLRNLLVRVSNLEELQKILKSYL